MRRFRRDSRTPEQKAARAAEIAAFKATQRECQICERHQCLSADGKLVLHGYKRPGYGFIEGSCFGVGFVDYARGSDALALYAVELRTMLANANANLQRYVRDEVTHFETVSQEYARGENGRLVYVSRKVQYVPVYTSWAPGVSNAAQYDAKLLAKKQDASRRVSAIEDELARVEARIAAQPAAAAKAAKKGGAL